MLSSIALSRSLPAFTLSLSMKEAGPTSTGTRDEYFAMRIIGDKKEARARERKIVREEGVLGEVHYAFLRVAFGAKALVVSVSKIFTPAGTGCGNEEPKPRLGLLSRVSGADSIVLSNVFETTSTIGFSENVDGGKGWGSDNGDEGDEETENELNVGLSSTVIPEDGRMFVENSGSGKFWGNSI